MVRVGIVGGGIAGVAAAKAASTNGAEVVLYERNEQLPPPRNEWPSLLAGEQVVSAERASETLSDFDVRLNTGTQVRSVDDGSRVITDNGSTSFDRVVLASGSRSLPQRVPGGRLVGVHVLDDPSSFVELGRTLDRYACIAVSGSGPLALDIIQVLVKKHVEVAVFSPLGALGSLLSDHLREGLENALGAVGVRTVYAAPARVAGVDRVEAIISDGFVHPCEALIVVPATAPNPQGVSAVLGRHGGIVVDAGMKSSQRRLLAAGDCSEMALGSTTILFATDSAARAMGHAAGLNSSGGSVSPRIVGSLHRRFFEIDVVIAGLSLLGARAAGFQAREATFSDDGSGETACSLVYDAGTRRVCGVEFVGRRAGLYAQLAPLIVSSSPLLDELAYHEFPSSFSTDISPLVEAARNGID